jgi:signal transduction histidine kinase
VPNVRRNLVALGPPLVVTLLGIVTVLGVQRERTETRWVSHTQSVRLAINAAFTGLRDTEAGVRGYVITGDTAGLLAYRTRLPLVAGAVDSIRELIADNPVQQRRLATLDTLIARKRAEFDAIVALTAAGRRDSAVAIVTRSQQQRVVNRIRRLFDAMDADEAALLAERMRNVDRQRRFVVWLVIGGTALGAALALLALQLLAHSARQLEHQAIELEASRDKMLATADELVARTQAAEEANRAKAQFLTTMSHELRTPLNAIDGYAELLEMGLRGPVTADQAADLARIRRSQRHLLSLVNDVLNFARLEAGRVEWQISDVPLDEALHGVEALIRPQLESKKIRYTRDACDPGVLLRADPEKLRQILVNLLGNAQKFTPPGGAVSIACDITEEVVRLHVRDTGRGIPPDKMGTIFDPFVQVDRHLNDGTPGVGLGLSISRDLARGMNGELDARSTPGAGSEFTLTIPRGRPTRLPEFHAAHAASRTPS